MNAIRHKLFSPAKLTAEQCCELVQAACRSGLVRYPGGRQEMPPKTPLTTESEDRAARAGLSVEEYLRRRRERRKVLEGRTHSDP